MSVVRTSVKVLFGCILYVCAIQLDTIWMKDNQFTDVISDKCLLDTVHGISSVSCASKCLMHENCKSFFHNKRSRICYHHATKFETDLSNNNTYMITQSGTSYFYNAIEHDKNISTPSKTVCAASRCEGFTYLSRIKKYFKIAQYSTSSLANATEQCTRNGGSLAAPKDQLTIDALERMIHNRMGGFENLRGFWVSARFSPRLNLFVWNDDNTPVLQSLWHPGKPNLFSKPDSKTECVVLVPLYRFKLADYNCNVSGDAIIPLCECK